MRTSKGLGRDNLEERFTHSCIAVLDDRQSRTVEPELCGVSRPEDMLRSGALVQHREIPSLCRDSDCNLVIKFVRVNKVYQSRNGINECGSFRLLLPVPSRPIEA